MNAVKRAEWMNTLYLDIKKKYTKEEISLKEAVKLTRDLFSEINEKSGITINGDLNIQNNTQIRLEMLPDDLLEHIETRKITFEDAVKIFEKRQLRYATGNGAEQSARLPEKTAD